MNATSGVQFGTGQQPAGSLDERVQHVCFSAGGETMVTLSAAPSVGAHRTPLASRLTFWERSAQQAGVSGSHMYQQQTIVDTPHR